jgi:hypothetical protein
VTCVTGWLEDHEALVVAAAAVAVALTALVLALLVLAALRQGRRALLGARPVARPPSFAPVPGGGLVLVVPIANVSEHPAVALRAEARVDGARLTGGVGRDHVFGADAGPLAAPGEEAARFDWPVGVLEGDVRVRWRWRDVAGRHRAEWRGHLRVPQPALPGAGSPGGPGAGA